MTVRLKLAAFFCRPAYWGKGHGRLLSLSRFLFMAEHLDRFDNETIAEMRGNVTENGFSPFWAAIGSHFFEIEFPQAETLTTNSKNVIADLFPRHPIYIPLLPDDAQATIAKVHQHTEPAKKNVDGRRILNIEIWSTFSTVARCCIATLPKSVP